MPISQLVKCHRKLGKITWNREFTVINITSFPLYNAENTNCQQSFMLKMENGINQINTNLLFATIWDQ